jgi:hypothetical protein
MRLEVQAPVGLIAVPDARALPRSLSASSIFWAQNLFLKESNED